MLNKNIYILFSILGLLFNSCYKKEYYDAENLRLKKVYSYNPVNKKKNGLFLRFLPNGDTAEIINYKNGVIHGRNVTFYNSGLMECNANFYMGELDGIFFEYYESGTLKKEVHYKNGKLWNIYTNNDSLGNHLDFGSLKDGYGMAKRYNYSNGIMSEKGMINNGLREGFWYSYGNDSLLIDSVFYKNGRSDYNFDWDHFLY